MAYIESIEIHGLLGRPAPFSVRFDRNLNVLYGLNGSGKTSVLNLLRSALGRDGRHADRVPFKHAKVFVSTSDGQTRFEHVLTRKPATQAPRRTVGTSQQTDHTVQLAIINSEKIRSNAWSYEFLPAYRIYESAWTASRQYAPASPELGSVANDVAFEAAINENWIRSAAQIQQSVSNLQTAAIGKIVAALISAQSQPETVVQETPAGAATIQPGDAYRRLLQFFGDRFQHPFTQAEFREVFSKSDNLRAVVSVLEDLENGVATARLPQTKLQEFLARLYTGDKKVLFTDSAIDISTSSDEHIGVRSLSSGEKHVLRILLGTYRAGSSSLIIDEPELSLHVGWQETLVSMMRELNPACQAIMATHSPEIVAATSQAGGKIIEL